MRVFDVYANILKCMHSTRFSGVATRSETSSDAQPTPFVAKSLTPTLGALPKPDKGKEKNPWILGKMFESGFPDASGREEG
jgi:hypothetical protein